MSGFSTTPTSWQGWLVSIVVIAVLFASRFVEPESLGLPHWTRLAFAATLVVAYLLLVWRPYDADD